MSDVGYDLLALLAYRLDVLEAARKAIQNQHRSLTAVPMNEFDSAKDLAGTPEALLLEQMLKMMSDQERETVKELEAATMTHPLAGPFIDARLGVGAKGIGRLLGAVGDPLWNGPAGRPRRGPAELWAYCGYHTIPAGDHVSSDTQALCVPGVNVRPRRQRGIQSNWNLRAKVAAFCVADSAYRQGHYRPFYVAKKEAAVTKTHTVECRNRVRPPGKPNGCATVAHPEWGEPGSPWRAGHQHQHSISMVAKQVLQDLFVAARDLAV